MKKVVKKIIAILSIITMSIISLFAFTACNKDDTTKITFLLDWSPNTNHTGLYVAQKLGYYAEEGLTVDIKQPGDTGTSLLVASGQAQFGVDFQEQMAPNYSKNITTTAVAAIIQHNTSGILSLKSDNVISPKAMGDKVYATWGLPIEQAIIKQIIENDGGSIIDESTFFYPDFVTDAISALDAGTIDCAWIYEGWDGIRAKINDADKYNYFAIKDYGEGNELDWYTPVIIANNDYLRTNPDETRAFLRATAKGYKFAIEHPDEAAEILIEMVPEFSSEDSRHLVLESQRALASLYKDDAAYWGEIKADRWDAFYKFLNDKGLVETAIPSGYGFSNDYLPKD